MMIVVYYIRFYGKNLFNYYWRNSAADQFWAALGHKEKIRFKIMGPRHAGT